MDQPYEYEAGLPRPWRDGEARPGFAQTTYLFTFTLLPWTIERKRSHLMYPTGHPPIENWLGQEENLLIPLAGYREQESLRLNPSFLLTNPSYQT
jgi:hypothetical protein